MSGAALPASLRAELKGRGVEVLQCYATAELGVVAYKLPAQEGMIVNETVILEIVRPGTGDPVPEGEVGEVVATTFNPDYPMIRLATGDLSAILPGRSPCGRSKYSHQGLDGPRRPDRQDQGHVRASQAGGGSGRAPSRARAPAPVVGREAEQDTMTLMAESASSNAALESAVAATLQAVTKLKGAVKLVAVGSLPNDGKVIADERPVGVGPLPPLP